MANARQAKKGYSGERNSLIIQAKNFGDIKAADEFIDLIANQNLQVEPPHHRTCHLKSRTPKQADPLDPEKGLHAVTHRMRLSRKEFSAMSKRSGSGKQFSFLP
jgi:hypothetical protein